jgi:hypothetical protein
MRCSQESQAIVPVTAGRGQSALCRVGWLELEADLAALDSMGVVLIFRFAGGGSGKFTDHDGLPVIGSRASR